MSTYPEEFKLLEERIERLETERDEILDKYSSLEKWVYENHFTIWQEWNEKK